MLPVIVAISGPAGVSALIAPPSPWARDTPVPPLPPALFPMNVLLATVSVPGAEKWIAPPRPWPLLVVAVPSPPAAFELNVLPVTVKLVGALPLTCTAP